MSENQKKSVLFTHDDLDGAGCSVVYALAHVGPEIGPDDVLIYNCSIRGIDNAIRHAIDGGMIGDETEINIADICCSRSLLEELVTRKNIINLWDHHRTNLWANDVGTERPNANINVIPENDSGVLQCGTSIMYQHYRQMAIDNPDDPLVYFFRDNNQRRGMIEYFVETVRSWDVWDWKKTNNIEAKRFQVLFFLLGMKRFCERYINCLQNPDVSRLINDTDGDFIDARMEAEQERIESFSLSDVIECDVRGHKTAFTLNTNGTNVSDLSTYFLANHPQFDIFASFYTSDGGTFAFRTIKDDLDLSEIVAKPIGGGGHPQACGAPISDEFREVLAEMLIAEMNGEAYHLF